MNGNELFEEIIYYHTSDLSIRERYVRLYALLDRLCKQLTADSAADFSNLFSRLHFLCRRQDIPAKAIEVFRIHGRQAQQRRPFPLTAEDYAYDLKALCETASRLLASPIPPRLLRDLPRLWRALPTASYQSEERKRMRVVVTRWDADFIYVYDEAYPSDEPFPVICPEEFASLRSLLSEGAQLNLLSVRSDEAGVLLPEVIVFEPDYLVDISALAACYTNYGHSPLQYLVNKLTPRETTFHTLLGNAANQFLDDCVNERPDAPATFANSIQKAFRLNVMEYCTCPDIDQDYFTRATMQFNHIHRTVEQSFVTRDCHIDKNRAVLEPSFLCECLGLQGRMDLLQSDGRNLIELKSGKAEEWGGEQRSKESHALQMALYKEVLHYNLDVPREEVHSFLFYSLYPKLFLERSSKAQIQRAIDLRNRIVGNELLIKHGHAADVMAQLTPDNLNERDDTSKLWTQWQRPRLEQLLAPFRRMNDTEAAYYLHFLTFVTKEQFLSKTGDARPDSSRGFSDLWNADLADKQASGNILTDLHIIYIDDNDGIESLTLSVPDYDEGFLPNFRQGDIVLLYERNTDDDNATNRQVFRGNIESITDHEIVFKLRHKQRNRQVFDLHGNYALEHDFMDSSYNNLYQGLYTFLTAPEARKQLILGLREPHTDTTRTLSRHYLNTQIDDIVLRAKQADDYFLLLGPPGTGKTSIALRSMVEEFHADPTCNILLLSYTNRAVDEICSMLESIPYGPDYVRIGSHLSCEKRFQSRLMQNVIATCTNRNAIRQAISNIRIFVGTTASVMGKTDLFRLKHFQVAIIDEASQILEPQIIGILCAHDNNGQCAIDKFILIGDHKQLPAVVLQTEKDSRVSDPALTAIGLTDCRNSFFERLYHLHRQHPQTGAVAMLDHQGRMHPAISEFANRRFYGGKLDIVPVPHQTAELDFPLYPDHTAAPLPYFLAHTRTGFFPSHTPPAADSNKINREEARITAQIVAGIYELCHLNRLPFQAAERIGIIVPFRNQIALIHHELHALGIAETDDITIDTVERYQGSQRDIIIYSTTISQPYQLDLLSVPVQDGALWVDRKLNVAITRAKKQFFLTGNAALLARNDIYRDFLATLTPYQQTDSEQKQTGLS